MITNRPIHNVQSRCKATIWHYTNQMLVEDIKSSTVFTEPVINQSTEEDNAITHVTITNERPYDPMAVTEYTLDNNGENSDNPILSFKYNKYIEKGTGEFVMQLAPTQNIAKMASPGDWIAIFLSQGPTLAQAQEAGFSTDQTTQAYVIASTTTSGDNEGNMPGTAGGDRKSVV